jgi:hypothetical protein
LDLKQRPPLRELLGGGLCFYRSTNIELFHFRLPTRVVAAFQTVGAKYNRVIPHLSLGKVFVEKYLTAN